MVKIWRQQIQRYLNGDAQSPPPPQLPVQISQADTPAEEPADSTSGLLENGHHIVAIPSGGVMCRKCGKYTSEPKHRRLKISSVP
jgi:hypothetical protein